MAIYATLAQARSFGITSADADDATVNDYLETASRMVDRYCGVAEDHFQNDVDRVHVAHDVRTGTLPLPTPVRAVTSVTINDGVALGPTAYQVAAWGIRLAVARSVDADGFPVYPRLRLASGSQIGNTVTVIGRFGYTVAPGPVRLATLHIAAGLVSLTKGRPASGTDDAGNVSVLPVAVDTDASGAPGMADQVEQLLDPYTRPKVA